MSTRSEYEAAKRLYKKVGAALRTANEKHLPAAKGLRRDYLLVKSEYHRLGKKVSTLRKHGR
jgi:hypothetical protein